MIIFDLMTVHSTVKGGRKNSRLWTHTNNTHIFVEQQECYKKYGVLIICLLQFLCHSKELTGTFSDQTCFFRGFFSPFFPEPKKTHQILSFKSSVSTVLQGNSSWKLPMYEPVEEFSPFTS